MPRFPSLRRRGATAVESLVVIASVAVIGALSLVHVGRGARGAIADEQVRPAAPLTSAQAASLPEISRVVERASELLRGAPRTTVRSVRAFATNAEASGAFGDVVRAVRRGEVDEGDLVRLIAEHGGTGAARVAGARITTPGELEKALGADTLADLERMFDGVADETASPLPWITGEDTLAFDGRTAGKVIPRRAGRLGLTSLKNALRGSLRGDAESRSVAALIARGRALRGGGALRFEASAARRAQRLSKALKLPAFDRRLAAGKVSLALMDFRAAGLGETPFVATRDVLYANTHAAGLTDGDILRQLSTFAEERSLAAADGHGADVRHALARVLNAETAPSEMIHTSARTTAQDSDALRTFAKGFMDEYAPELTELMALAEPGPIDQNDALGRFAATLTGSHLTPATRLRVHLASFQDLATRYPERFGALRDTGTPALFDRGLSQWDVVINTDALTVNSQTLREELGHALTLLTTP